MWTCCQTGACCLVGEVTMTPAERRAIEQAVPPSTVAALVWSSHPDTRFTRLLTTGRCPLLSEANRCTVYAVRPYNCRRYGCFRTDYTEPPDLVSAVPLHVRTSARLTAEYAAMQRKAQRWARAHDWPTT